jgi:hypothetical protein
MTYMAETKWQGKRAERENSSGKVRVGKEMVGIIHLTSYRAER